MVMTTTQKIYVVYGSETRLLGPLFSDKSARFIRIYGKNHPLKAINCVDIHDISQLKVTLSTEILSLGSSLPRLVFVGAAFKSQRSLFSQVSEDEIDLAIDVNIRNYMRIVKILLPFMIEAKWGRMIYLSSFRSVVTGKGTSIYSACKAFGEKFFEIIGKEYGRVGISTTTIRMGYFDGRMTDAFSKEKVSGLQTKIASKRLGNSDDLYNAIKFAENNAFSNSGVLDLNGGLVFDH